MKKVWKHIISCVVVGCLLVAVLGYLTNLMERKNSYAKYKEFFDQEENFDVLFMGTSHVINGVYPMELWDDYGIISYNFGGHANQIPTTYWVMRNALDYTTPQLVVVDCWGLSSDIKGYDAFSYLHLSLDAFPLSTTKVQAVWDLLDDPVMDEMVASGTTRESDEPRTKIGLVWDYSVYHSRWNEIGQRDFEPSGSIEKGAEIRTNVNPGVLNKIDQGKKFEQDSVGVEYIYRTIEECQSRGIDILLIYLPFPAGEQSQMEANRVYDIAEKYQINYINFLDMDVVDYQTDCYDADSHLNPSGARKVTEYLGQYITENYDVDDQRKNQEYSFWHEDYNEYQSLKLNHLRSQESLMNYLMLLSGDRVDVVLAIRNTDIFKNQDYLNLLSNLGVNIAELGDNTDFIMIQNGGKYAAVLNDFEKRESDIDVEMGNLEDDFSMRCIVTNCVTGEEVDFVDFTYMVDPESADVHVFAVKR